MRTAWVLVLLLLASCARKDPIEAAYQKCVQDAQAHGMSTNPNLPTELRQSLEQGAKAVIEQVCALGREACKADRNGTVCRAYLDQYN